MTSKHHSAQTEQSKLCRDNTYDSPILRKHFYLTLGSPKLALRVYEVKKKRYKNHCGGKSKVGDHKH